MDHTIKHRIYIVDWNARGSNKNASFAHYVDHLRHQYTAHGKLNSLLRFTHDLIDLSGSCVWLTSSFAALSEDIGKWHNQINYQVSPCFQPSTQVQQRTVYTVPLVAAANFLYLTYNDL